jgi:Cobinamide kinase / cobinamide phosphate guanyltransferase
METLDLEAVLAGHAPGALRLADPGLFDPHPAGPGDSSLDPRPLGDSNLVGPTHGHSKLAGRTPGEPDLAGPVGSRRLEQAPLATPVLVDCLSTWLAGVMEECGVWADAPDADKQVAERVDGLVDAWRSTRRHVVAVSNEVGSGVIPGTVSGVRFRDELGVLNARIAAECEQVWLCVAGIAQRLR